MITNYKAELSSSSEQWVSLWLISRRGQLACKSQLLNCWNNNPTVLTGNHAWTITIHNINTDGVTGEQVTANGTRSSQHKLLCAIRRKPTDKLVSVQGSR